MKKINKKHMLINPVKPKKSTRVKPITNVNISGKHIKLKNPNTRLNKLISKSPNIIFTPLFEPI